ncbi:TonB-dependent receptor [Salinibacter sp. 10B]|nr:TonB-dependent receptor [Salinibacter sp. 10B]
MLAWVPPVWGQQGGQDVVVQGFVRDVADGQSLQGANVAIRSPSGVVEEAATTNGRGFYQMSGIAPGQYQLTISFVGYRAYQDTLQLSAGSRQTISIALKQQPRRLDEVTIRGRAGVEESEAGLQEIRRAEIERVPTPGPGGDLASYLRRLPGVTAIGDRGGRLFVRGGRPSQNLVLVDGIPVYKPFHIIGFYSAFPSELVSSADFYAGGFGAEHMGRISSVLDVQFRSGNTKEYEGSIGIGPFLATAHAEGPLETGAKSFLVHARHSVVEYAGPSLTGEETPYRFYDVVAKVQTQGGSSQCSFMGLRTYDRGRIDPDQKASIRWDNTSVGGDCLLFSGQSAQTLDVSFGTSHFNNTVRSSDGTVRTAGTWKVHGRWQLAQPLLDGTLQWGGAVHADKYALKLNEPFLGLATAQKDRFLMSASTHVGGSWTWNDRLTLQPSVGTQALFAWDGLSIDPRLRFSYRPGGSNTMKITAAAGLYHQFAAGITDERDAGSSFQVWLPSPFENTPLEAQHALLGWKHQLLSALRFSVEGWYKQFRDLPVPRWTPIVRFNTELTRAEGTAYGADVSLVYDADPLRINAQYGYGTVTYRSGRERLGAWGGQDLVEYTPPHDIRHKVGLTTSFRTGWVQANLRWQYSTGGPYTQVYGYDTLLEIRGLRESPEEVVGIPRTFYDRPYDARLPAYHRLDVSLRKTFDVSSEVGVTAEAGAINVYNRANVFYVDIFTLNRVDQLPLLPYVSVKIDIQ